MAGYIVFMFSSLLLATAAASGEGEDYQGKLTRAYASPLNVDPKLDCAVKELAWEYAKKLLPRVSDRCRQYCNFLSSNVVGLDLDSSSQVGLIIIIIMTFVIKLFDDQI